MATTKKSPSKLKTKTSLSANKKQLFIILAVFAAVGVALLIRSFASTIVVSVNYVTSFNSKDPSLGVISKGGTPPVVVSEPDGKKTVNYLQTSQDGLSYNFKLQPGFYQACINAKPTTAGAKAEVRSVIVGSTTAEPVSVTTQEDGGKTRAINAFKETCVNVISRDLNQSLSAMFIPTSGTWRLSTLTVKTLEQQSEEISLSAAFQSKDPRFTFSGASVHYDTVRGKNVLKLEPNGSASIKISELKYPLFNAYVFAKAAGPEAVAEVGLAWNQKGGSKTYPVTSVPAGGNTNEQLTTTAYGALSFTGGLVDYSQLSPSNPVNLVVKANQGALYLDQINIYNAAYGSYGSN